MGLMSSKADFIVAAVADDAQQQNSIPISKSIATAARAVLLQVGLR